ncbi:MAG: alpha/beta fold hydrolase [Pseudomonadota bacterium]
MKLAYDRYGDGPERPLLVAHGLFGSARNWRTLARKLSAERQVIAVDMRHHGASQGSGAMTYTEMAADLAAVVEEMGGNAHVLGHSMGGKAAMALALMRPDLVDRLIVADIAPVGYVHSQLPAIDAMRAIDLAPGLRRSQAQAAIAALTGDPNLAAFLSQSLDTSGAKPFWTLNLDALAQGMDAIIGFPDQAALHGDDLKAAAHQGPTLFLIGGLSDYVRPEHRPRIKALFPLAQTASIPGAGHWLHAEKPAEFLAAVETFLNR